MSDPLPNPHPPTSPPPHLPTPGDAELLSNTLSAGHVLIGVGVVAVRRHTAHARAGSSHCLIVGWSRWRTPEGFRVMPPHCQLL